MAIASNVGFYRFCPETGRSEHDNIADAPSNCDNGYMVSFYNSFPYRWTAPLNLDGLRHSAELRGFVGDLRALPLHWRWASANDWPPKRLIAGDFRFARKSDFGFTTEFEEQKLFLVPRGWLEPEWGLASYNLHTLNWRDLGDFEPVPEHWTLPTLEERSTR